MKYLSKRASPIVKTCGCGKSYTQEQWDKLPYKGLIDIRSHLPEDEKDWPGALLELRDCPCLSTLALPVSPEKAEHLKKTYGK